MAPNLSFQLLFFTSSLIQLHQFFAHSAPTSSQQSKLSVAEIKSASTLASRETNQAAAMQMPTNVDSSALIYLQKFGYINAPANGAETNNLISEESFSSAIADFQKFAGINVTGFVDKETLHYMKLPRCGLPDIMGHNVNGEQSSSQLVRLPSVRKSGSLSSRRARLIADANSIHQNNQPSAKLSESAAKLPGDGAAIRRKKRRKRYALQGSKWRRQELTYRISQYPTRFNGKKHEVDAQIAKAFGIWSQVAPIDFVVRREGRVNIDIRFASGDHGDGDAFDGPGNTLAHAYFPQYGGDAHFDDQEFWTIDSYAGTNIFQVAAHELGHSLGLGHSNVREALMAPFYQKYRPNFRLHLDDIMAIQALYGEKSYNSHEFGLNEHHYNTIDHFSTSTTTTTTSTSTTPGPVPGGRHESSVPDLATNNSGTSNDDDQSFAQPKTTPSAYPADLCSDSSIDAITRTEDGRTYVFKGEYYWLLTNEGLARGHPKRINVDWPGLPNDLDAALTWADGKTFFFKGNKYWRFRNRRREIGYPKLISAGFAGIPDDLDAAFVWSGNGRTYFFKGGQYWRFDSKTDPPVGSDYPRPIQVWSGLPDKIDAAFKWENNVTYFFSGSQYYRFNDKEFRVETRGKPQFPRQTSEWWFGCVVSNLAQRALPSALDGFHQMQPNIESEHSEVDKLAPEMVADWSLLVGLQDKTGQMGTHISDHDIASPSSDYPSTRSMKPNQIDSRRLHEPTHTLTNSEQAETREFTSDRDINPVSVHEVDLFAATPNSSTTLTVLSLPLVLMSAIFALVAINWPRRQGTESLVFYST